MSSSITYNRGRKRSGFTLTELLIGITIIGLLVGMLAVAGSRVVTGAREFAINSEITQISQAIESFKTENGFYPPSFEQFQRTGVSGRPIGVVQAEANQLLPFLNKIAPNHRELDLSPTRGTAAAPWRRIDDWWENVGVGLNQSTSLQFWLSGLANSKQYPLTGGLTPPTGVSPTPPYISVGFNAPLLCDATPQMNDNPETDSIYPAPIERKVYYDFDNDRLECFEENDTANQAPNVTAYNAAYHKTNSAGAEIGIASFFVYRDAGSYVPGVFAGNAALTPIAYNPGNPAHGALAYHILDGTPDFANPNTFQLVSFGMDSDAGIVNSNGLIAPENRGALNPRYPTLSDAPRSLTLVYPTAADNLCNFGGGRLDKYIDDQQ